ncbi:MAG: lipopolysaccharide biosynthesis protein [Pseudomonadota bacterium]
MSLTRQVVGGAIWLAAARIGGQVFGLASTIIVARFILPDDYGVFAAAMSILMLASVFADLPVSQAIIHLRDIREDDYDTAFTIGLLRGLIVATVMLCLAWPFAHFMNDDRIAPVTVALGGYIALTGLRNPRMDAFAREMDFSKEALVEVIAKFASFVAAAIFASILKNYWALVLSIMAMAAVQVALSYVLRPVSPRLTLASFRRLFGYSIWMAGFSVMSQIYQLIDTMALGRIRGSAVLGTYSIGSLLSSRVSDVVALPVSRSLFAAFSSIQAEKERLQRAFLQSMAFMATMLAPLLLSLIWFAEPFVLVVLGEKWQSATVVVQFLALVMVSHIVFTPMLAALMGLGHTRTLFIRSACFVFVYAPVAVLSVVKYGLEGLIIAKAIMILGLTLVDCAIIRHALDLGFVRQMKTVMRPVLSAISMAIVFMLTDGWVPAGAEVIYVGSRLATVCLAGGVAYGCTLMGVWHLSGQPDGPEKKLIMLFGQGLKRLGPEMFRQ